MRDDGIGCLAQSILWIIVAVIIGAVFVNTNGSDAAVIVTVVVLAVAFNLLSSSFGSRD